jgi:hypothetical protein
VEQLPEAVQVSHFLQLLSPVFVVYHDVEEHVEQVEHLFPHDLRLVQDHSHISYLVLGAGHNFLHEDIDVIVIQFELKCEIQRLLVPIDILSADLWELESLLLKVNPAPQFAKRGRVKITKGNVFFHLVVAGGFLKGTHSDVLFRFVARLDVGPVFLLNHAPVRVPQMGAVPYKRL